MRQGRARSQWQSTPYALRLWDGPAKGIADEGELKQLLDGWVADKCKEINPATGMPFLSSEALRIILLDLIRHWVGLKPPARPAAAAQVDVAAIADQVRAQVLSEVRGWLERMREDGYSAAAPSPAYDDSVDPVTDDVLDNILADFNGEFNE